VKGRRDLAATAAYEPEPAAAAAARRFVRETLRSWQVPDRSGRLVDDAVLLTSELVTNAVVHAGTLLQVSCRLDRGEIEVAVRDRHPSRTIGDEPGQADNAERTSGRGLMLPAALASSWGVSYARTAKAVWFRLVLDPVGPAATDQAAPHEREDADGEPAGVESGPAAHAFAQGSPDLWEACPVAAGPGAPDGALGAAPIPPMDAIGRLSYDELLRRTVEMARDMAGADAAYAFVADEDGELRIRAGAGIGTPEILAGPAGPAARVAQGSHDAQIPGRLPAIYDDVAHAAEVLLPKNAGARSLVTVPFLAEGRVTGVLAAAAAEPNRFSGGDAERLQQVADRVALSLERARLAELERVRRGRISFLAEASDLLAGTLDEDKTIALAAQLVVPRLATWCAVYLADDDGPPRPAYVWHSDETLADALAMLLARVPLPDVPSRAGARRWSLAGLPPSALPPSTSDFASDAVWCCPLVARGRVLGAFVIGRPRGERFSRETVEMVEDLGRRAALALDNARLYSQQFQTNRALQRSLLPPEVPRIPGVDLAAEYEAAGEGNEVGGDFYDVFAVEDDRWRFAIGDVCGTGPEAAAVTGLARYTMRILAREGRGLAAVLDRLNRLILDEGPRGRFVTLVHGEIVTLPGPPPVTRVSMICAGHPLPLLMRAKGKPESAVSPGPLLGVLDEVAFRAKSVDLDSGDVLLFVTDGVTERRNGSQMLDDGDGLSQVFADCAGLNAGAIAARIMRAVRDFTPQPLADDTALIVLRAL
jgi:serine phosphatase RsbU (regulator of sigma subunit)/anti-sigma regulatory factor (Ser/Thr protein kinase)